MKLTEKAVSKAQRRLFAIAWKVRKGEIPRSEASEPALKIADGSMTDKELQKMASTKEEGLPDKVEEEVSLNPGMNVPGMGAVSLPDNPGTTTQFHNQTAGSGDTVGNILKPKKKKKKKDREKLKSSDEFRLFSFADFFDD